MPELRFEDGERADLGAFAARAVRLDQDCMVRLRARGDGRLDSWVPTPFGVLATRTVRGTVEPSDVTVSGAELLAALEVARTEVVDPGPVRDLLWRSAMPPQAGWQLLEELPVAVVSDLAERGLAVARENVGPKGTPPASLLDQEVLSVEGSGLAVKVPLRCLFAVSGMGFLGGEGAEKTVRVSATDSWLRIDARYGAVVRRRHALLPLLL